MATAGDARVVADWLIDGAHSAATPEQIVADMCERLVRSGVPLWRVGVFVRTLHPEVMGRRFLWREGAGVTVWELPFEVLESAEFRAFVARLSTSGAATRHRLADENCLPDFEVLKALRAEGATDYLAWPLVFSNGETHAVTWTTRQPGGFTDTQISQLQAVLAPLARLTEIHALRRTASNLLNTYVGHHTGERIWAGQIRRGHAEAIHAAIWLSDMRGFTALADRLPPNALIKLLNRYFDCQVPPILAHGGEVLKFMGDGLLAIFPIAGTGAGAAETCKQALAAACEARANVAMMREEAGIGDSGGPRFGLALHLGEILYGNIGSGNRLDFTCIGPAVNLAARLEKLAATLGRAIIASGEFARHCRPQLTHLGEFTLPGFATAQAAFGLGDEPALS